MLPSHSFEYGNLCQQGSGYVGGILNKHRMRDAHLNNAFLLLADCNFLRTPYWQSFCCKNHMEHGQRKLHSNEISEYVRFCNAK